MAKSDTDFARTATALKLVTPPQANECLQHFAQMRKQGQRGSLADVFVQKGYLTREQVAAVAKAASQPRITHIGRFQLLAKVGQGGMGTVYKARQESLDKIVALKVLAPGLAKQKDFVERFIREAQSAGRLNHPNIALGIDAGEADGYYFFAMEFVEGDTVKALLQRDGPMPEQRALEIAGAMADALGHAAEHNIVHRDIKPGNILLAADGTPKLVDLGLAKEIRTDQSITQAGIPVGTPYYISPEQVRGQQQVDIRADIYALGGTLCHMVTGHVPYEGPTAAVVMTRHLNDPIPDPREHTPGLSDATVAIIQHCMAKDPDARYRTPAELRADIDAALAGKPLPHAKLHRAPGRVAERIAERRAQQAARQRTLLIAGGAGAGVLALAIIVAVIVASRGGGGPDPKPTTQVVIRPRTKLAPKPRTRTKPRTKVRVEGPKPDAVLKELVALAAEDEDPEAIENRFQEFVLKYAGTAAAGQAKTRLAELKARWKAEDDFKTLIQEHLREGRFAAALAAAANPPVKAESARARDLLAGLAQDARRAATEHVSAQKTRGEELIRQSSLDEARELYRQLAKLGLDDATAASRAALQQIADLEIARTRREAQRLLAARVAEAAEHVKAGRLDAAQALFAPEKAAANAALTAHFQDARSDLARIRKLFDAVEAKLRALAGESGRALIRGIARPIAKVEDGIVHTTIGSRKEQFPIAALLAVDLERLECAPSPESIPLLELYRGDLADAKEGFTKLEGDGAKRCLEWIGWVSAIGREGEAADLLANAQKLADGKKWAEAQAAVAKLIDAYADTAFVEKNRAAIDGVAGRCVAALAPVRRDDEPIKPFVDVTDRCGPLSEALKTLRPVGGWVMDIDNDNRLDIALDIRRKPGDPLWVPVFFNRTEKAGDPLDFRSGTRVLGLGTGDEPICWADLDGAGDLDVVCRGLWTTKGASSQSDHSLLSIYENDPKRTPMMRLRPETLSSILAKAKGFGGVQFGNIAVLDANGDGLADVLAQAVSGQTRTLALFLSAPDKRFAFHDYTLRAGFVNKQGDDYVVPPYLTPPLLKAWPQYVVLDADGDRRADFLLVADSGMLFRNRGGRGFSYDAKSPLAFNTFVQPNNSPLIIPACADYDNDGDIDVFVPQQGRNLLFRNEGDGKFVDAMATAGPMSTDEAVSLWATWADVNNDGLLDLFVCNSGERNRLYIQKSNHAFADKADEYGIAGERDEKTNFVAFGDLDRDGDLDMIILRENGRNQVLLNPTVTGNNRYYLTVVVRPPKGAIGARVTLHRPTGQIVGMQQVCRVEGYNGQTSREAFFGVPSAGDYVVTVELSNGSRLTKRLTLDPTRRNYLVVGK